MTRDQAIAAVRATNDLALKEAIMLNHAMGQILQRPTKCSRLHWTADAEGDASPDDTEYQNDPDLDVPSPDDGLHEAAREERGT